MALGKRLINTGAAAAAACSTDSVQAFGADDAFSSNIALYQLDGNDDDTTGNYDGISDPNVTYATGQFGNAAVFNGSSSKIELPSALSDGVTTDATCISFWFNVGAEVTSSTTDNEIMEFAGTSSLTGKIALGSTSGHMSGETFSVSSNIAGTYTYSRTNIPAGWNHAVVQWNSSDVKWDIYINAVKHTTYTVGTQAQRKFKLKFGNRSTAYYTGSLDQVRIFDKPLSAEDVGVLYAETTSTASNTNPFSEGAGVALYTMDYDASEASGYFDGTPTNVEFGVGGKINYGARFNGSSSGINLPSSLNTSVIDATGAFSISMWINANDISTIQYLFSASTVNNIDLGINSNNQGVGKIVWTVYNTSYSYLVSTTTITTNTWYNIVVTYDNGSSELFINGASQGTITKTLVESSIEPTLGYRNTGGSVRFNGSIDQVRIFSKALSTDEVDELFVEAPCVYECTTDDVNYPFSDGTNVEAYYKLDNSAEDETGSYDGTESNIEYRFGRFGQAAVFNGSSSKIQLPTSTFSPSTFSLSAWCNVTSDTDENTILELFDNQTYPNHTTIVFSAGSTTSSSRFLLRNYATNQYNYNPSGTVSKNVWKHYAMTYDGSTVKSYIDGSLVDSGSLTLSNTVGTISSIQIGLSSASRHLNGDIDQVRIYSTALTGSQVTELYEEKPCADTSNFKAVLYEGNGDTSNPTYISNVGFDLDVDDGGDGGLVWIKARTTGYNHLLMDSVRGTTSLTSNDTTAEKTNYNRFQGYEANGFSILANNAADLYKINRVGQDYVAWVWKGGGDAVNIGVNSITGSTPSIASDVSANKEAGFSIVKFTVPASGDFTVAHGLDNPPEMVITKSTDSFNWFIFHKDLSSGANGKYSLKFTTAAENGSYKWWGNGMTSDVIGGTANTSFDPSTETIAYCWHSVAGYSKIGSYTGTGVAGQSIVTGFRPSFVMLKKSSSTGSWVMLDDKRDTSNPITARLYADLGGAETSPSFGINILSNGFDFNAGSYNDSGATYIYMAFK